MIAIQIQVAKVALVDLSNNANPASCAPLFCACPCVARDHMNQAAFVPCDSTNERQQFCLHSNAIHTCDNTLALTVTNNEVHFAPVIETNAANLVFVMKHASTINCYQNLKLIVDSQFLNSLQRKIAKKKHETHKKYASKHWPFSRFW